MKIVFTDGSKSHYTEIEQQVSIKMSPALYEKNCITEQKKPFNCRDYFNEWLYAVTYKKQASIYGFSAPADAAKSWNPDVTCITLWARDQDTADNFKNNIEILFDLEKKNDLPSSLVFEDAENKLRFAIVGDKIWHRTAYMLSLYSFLVKVMGHKFTDPKKWQKELLTYSPPPKKLQGDPYQYEGGSSTTNEKHYWGCTHEKLSKYLTNIQKYCKTDHGVFGAGVTASGCEVGSLHNHNGIVSVFSKSSIYSGLNKYWPVFNELL